MSAIVCRVDSSSTERAPLRRVPNQRIATSASAPTPTAWIVIPSAAAKRAADRGSTWLAVSAPSVSNTSTRSSVGRSPKPLHREANRVTDRGLLAGEPQDRLGNHLRHGLEVEGEWRLQVCAGAEEDETDPIPGPARDEVARHPLHHVES